MHKHNAFGRFIAAVMRTLAGGGWGTCYCCKWPWRLIEKHITYYEQNRGCFPLCQHCWKKLSEDQHPIEAVNNLLPFYNQLADDWRRGGNVDPYLHKKLENAVRIEGGLQPRNILIYNLNPVIDHVTYIESSTGDPDFDEAIKKWQSIL